MPNSSTTPFLQSKYKEMTLSASFPIKSWKKNVAEKMWQSVDDDDDGEAVWLSKVSAGGVIWVGCMVWYGMVIWVGCAILLPLTI